MIDVYKFIFITGKYDINCSVKLQSHSCTASTIETSSNMYKLVPDKYKYKLQRNYFSHRIVLYGIVCLIISAESVDSFKSRFDKNSGVRMTLYMTIEYRHRHTCQDGGRTAAP